MKKGISNLFLKLSFKSFIVTASFFFQSCSYKLPYGPPCVTLPEEWKNELTSEELTAEEQNSEEKSIEWWKAFDDPRLDELVEHVLAQNLDVNAARYRVEAARQKAIMSASALLPQILINPLYGNSIALSHFFGFPGAERFHARIYNLPFSARYELDLFGKNYYTALAEENKAEASQKALQGMILSLITDLAVHYYQLLSCDTQIALLENVLVNRTKAVHYNEDLFQAELISSDSVALAKAELAVAETEKISLLRRRNDLENMIAVLCGQTASSFKLDPQILVEDPPKVPRCLPSGLLMQRPDISEAYKILQSNNALLGFAKADLYPSLLLEGQLGLEAPFARLIFDWQARYWSATALITQTVFDAGKKNANVRLTRAQYNESLSNFYQRILIAIQEVEDSLSGIRYYAEENEKQGIRVFEQHAAFDGLMDKYQAGLIDYINAVDAENALLNAQRAKIITHGERFIAIINLIKALGGGWNYPEEEG